MGEGGNKRELLEGGEQRLPTLHNQVFLFEFRAVVAASQVDKGNMFTFL